MGHGAARNHVQNAHPEFLNPFRKKQNPEARDSVLFFGSREGKRLETLWARKPIFLRRHHFERSFLRWVTLPNIEAKALQEGYEGFARWDQGHPGVTSKASGCRMPHAFFGVASRASRPGADPLPFFAVAEREADATWAVANPRFGGIFGFVCLFGSSLLGWLHVF